MKLLTIFLILVSSILCGCSSDSDAISMKASDVMGMAEDSLIESYGVPDQRVETQGDVSERETFPTEWLVYGNYMLGLNSSGKVIVFQRYGAGSSGTLMAVLIIALIAIGMLVISYCTKGKSDWLGFLPW